MKNLIDFESINEAAGPAMPKTPKEVYDLIVNMCKDPKTKNKCYNNAMHFKPTNMGEEIDHAFYVAFVNSVVDKNPLLPIEYVGKRLLKNKKLLAQIMDPNMMK